MTEAQFWCSVCVVGTHSYEHEEIKDTHRLGAPTSAERHNNYTRVRHNKRPL